MAFCTSCGASVSGAFCPQCGTPVRAAAQASAPPPPVPNPPYQAAPSAPAAVPPVQARRGTNPLIWVLVIIAGLFVLGGVAVVGTGLFVVHKARQAGLDTDLLQNKPGLAIAKMMAAANPDVDVLSTDDGAGTITVRDKKTGKVTTLSFDDARHGRFSITAQDDNGKKATLQFGGSANNLPSWIPAYPGSSPQIAMAGNAEAGNGGTFAFSTDDAPSRVIEYYQDKMKDLGMKVSNVLASSTGGMLNGTDDNEHRTLNVIVGASSGKTGVTVTYSSK